MDDVMDTLVFDNNKSYLVFKILSDYFQEKTKLAITQLTWENILEYKEINFTHQIYLPPIIIEGIKNPLALVISRMRITEFLNEYELNATNKQDLKTQFLAYNEKMRKYHLYESEDIDDFQDNDEHFDNFGEPFYETD